MSNAGQPPAKRLLLSSNRLEIPPTPRTDQDDAHSDSDGDDHFEIADEGSDFSDNEELEVTYERHEATEDLTEPPPSSNVVCSENSNVNPAAASFILSLHEKCLASQSEREEIVSDAKLLAKDCMRQFASSVDNALRSKGLKLSVSDILNVEKTVSSTCYNTFLNIESKRQQENYFKEVLGVSEVRRIPLGKIFIRGRKGSVMKTKVVDQEFMYIPIEETVQKLINHPDYKVFMKNNSSTNSDILDSYMKGELSKQNKVLKNHPEAKRFLLYYDDVELCSPLKSRAGKQKVGAFYLLLENIPLKFRSCLKVICLVGLVNANFIKGKSYGMDAALQVIVNDLKKFETGVTLKSGEIVYGTLIATIGDNLGQHSLGGFKEGFTAHRCCRVCMARYDFELKTLTREDESLLRNEEDYVKQVQQIQTGRGKNEKASTEFGLNRESCLNQLDSFHVLKNMPYDLMHDVLEGCLSITLKHLLKYYLYEAKEKRFTLDWLNQCISNFDFDYAEAKDKPSELKEDFIKDTSSTSLHQSASQLWLLATILPLILRPHVVVTEERWANYIDLLEICRMLFTTEFPRWMVVYLKDCIDNYLTVFIKLYGSRSVIPKLHFLIHFPRMLLLLGSLVIYMCMRCESNHKYYKRIISAISAYKNIPLFLARKDQLHQAYIWKKNGLINKTATGPQKTVQLKSVFYSNLVKTSNGEVTESSWLELNGVTFKPDRCFIVIGFENHLPVFALIKKIIIFPEVAFICEEVTSKRDVLSACFIVSLKNKFCVLKPDVMLVHSVFHAHKYCGQLAIVSKYCIGGEP